LYNEPRMAMPMAEPSSRDTSFIADPTPCLARGSDVTMAVVEGVDVSAMPKPKTIRPARKCQYVEPAVSWDRIARPTPRHASPADMTARAPNRSTMCGATLDIGITIAAIGSRQSALCNGLYPRISSRNCSPTMKKPKRHRNWTVNASVPVLKPRSENSRTSSIGLGVCSSHRTNATSAATATEKAMRAVPEVQPASAPSMMP
jgi:hypothetical protein